MNLLIFDIDGTIINSVEADDRCFIQTFQDLHQIDLSSVDWNQFQHVTDSGMTEEIFDNHYGRSPSSPEIENIKNYYFNLLSINKEHISEINGATTFIDRVSKDSNMELAFATGGWRDNAIVKCSAIGFKVDDYNLKTASDHFDRGTIIQKAIDESCFLNGVKHYRSITYIGDGLWDLKTTEKMNINFIGVDYHRNNLLKNAGAKKVINDYEDVSLIEDWLDI